MTGNWDGRLLNKKFKLDSFGFVNQILRRVVISDYVKCEVKKVNLHGIIWN